MAINPNSVNPTDRDERLREATGQAAARWTVGRAEIEHDPGPPRPGDLFVLATSGELLVEWLVVEENPEEARFLLVAADDDGEVGSCDVAIGSEGTGGMASVRSAIALWLDAGALDPRRRTGALSADALDQVRRKRSALADGALTGSPRQCEVDEDPVYQRRMEELGELKAALEVSLGGTPQPKTANVMEFRPRGRGLGSHSRASYALAASILLSLGLGSAVVFQHHKLAFLEDELRETPHLNLPVIWLTADEGVRGEGDPFVVPSEARRLALLLEVASPKQFPRYRVNLIQKERGEVVWASDELVESGSELSFDLPRSLLTTGSYELGIFGLGAEPGAVAEPLATYSIRIQFE